MDIFTLTGKMAIDGLDKTKQQLTGLEKNVQKVQKGMKIMGAAFTAVGAAGLAIIQSTKKMNAQLGVTALNLGISTKEMRELALETTNVTFPLDEVTKTFDLLARAGVKDQKVLRDTATAFDTLGDALGVPASVVTAQLIPAMKTFNISAEEMAGKTDSLTWLFRNTTVNLEDFNRMVGYTTPELVEMGLTTEDMIAILAELEEQGYSGEVMTREFRKAVTLATKEQIPLNEALGISTEKIEGYKEQMEGATGLTQKYADVANEQYTILDKLKQKWSELTLGASGFLEPLEPILAGMTALGPLMIVLSTSAGTAAIKWGLHTGALIAHKVALIASTIAIKAVTVAQWLWNAAMTANPIGLIIAGIAALVAAGIALWKNWDKVKVFFEKLWANMKIVFGNAIKFIVGTVLQPFLLYIEHWIGNLTKGIAAVVRIFNKDWAAAIDKVADTMQNLGQEMTDWADKLIESGETSKGAFAKISEAAKETGTVVDNVFLGMGEATEEASEKIRELADEYEKYIASIEKLIEADELAQTEAGKLGLTLDDLKSYMIGAGREAELLALSYEDWLEIGDDIDRFASRFQLNLRDIARASETTTDSMLRDLSDLTRRAKDSARERTKIEVDAIDDRMDAHRNAHQERMDALQDEYNATIKTIDAELAYALEGYQSQIEAIDRQIEDIEDAEKGRRDAERKGELEASIAEEGDADKRLDLERRLDEFLIESDNDLWRKERELAYETRIAEERDADKRRWLEQRLVDFLLEVQAKRTRKQLEIDRDTLRQEMEMAREEANNVKDRAQESYDYRRTLQEQEHNDLINHLEREKEALDKALERQLKRYDDDLKAFTAMLEGETLKVEDLAAALAELKDKIIKITTEFQEVHLPPIGAPAAAPAAPTFEEYVAAPHVFAPEWYRFGTAPEVPTPEEVWKKGAGWQGGVVAMREMVGRIGEQAPRIPEAVLPLTKETFERLGLIGGGPTVNVYIDEMNVRDPEDADRMGEAIVKRIYLRTGARV